MNADFKRYLRSEGVVAQMDIEGIYTDPKIQDRWIGFQKGWEAQCERVAGTMI